MDPESTAGLLGWFYISVVAAALTATAFPILYSLGPWYKDPLGRALMWKALSFAFIIDLTAIFYVDPLNNLTLSIAITTIAFSLVSFSTGYLTWMLWHHNFIRPKKEDTMRTRSEYQEAIRKSGPFLSDPAYTALRRLVEYVLPAAGALYFTLAEIWGLPRAAEVVGTFAAINTFLGVVVHISRKNYNESDAKFDGQLNVDTSDPERDIFQVDLGDDLPNLASKDAITLKVKSK